MGACLSKCGGKYFVRKEDKKEDGGDTPKLVNKVEHNASFKEADKKNGEANGAAAANGKTRKDSSSSSSNSEAGEAEDKVRSKCIVISSVKNFLRSTFRWSSCWRRSRRTPYSPTW